MDDFLNDRENVHDSNTMSFVREIYNTCEFYADSSINGYNYIISQTSSADITDLQSGIRHITQQYDIELMAMFQFIATVGNTDLAEVVIDEIKKMWKAGTAGELVCPTGFINNVAVLFPVYYAEVFVTTIVPVPVVMSEIDALIDLAVDTAMDVNTFINEISIYLKKYSDIPLITSRCSDLLNFYISAYAP